MHAAKRSTARMILASGMLYAAQAVAGGESGSFRYVASLVHDYTTLEHAGQTVTGGPLHGTFTVTGSSGGPFAEGQKRRRGVFRLLHEVGGRDGPGNPLHEHRCLG